MLIAVVWQSKETHRLHFEAVFRLRIVATVRILGLVAAGKQLPGFWTQVQIDTRRV
jgi:hypothetical protein